LYGVIGAMETQIANNGLVQVRDDDMFASHQAVQRALGNVGYITNLVTTHTIFYASHLRRPILQEGPAGAGKTELAVSLSRASGMPLVRLQCYDGISDKEAIGEYNRAMQELYVLINKEANRDWRQLREEIVSREFFIAGPLLQAIEAPERVILLIDEIDKIPHAFEAMLLELLSVWQLSVPGLGTITAKTIPFTILTSNAEREIGDPLRRRSLYLLLEHPSAMQQATIVARKSPTLSPRTHLFIAGFAHALRAFNLEKPPSISEMNDLAQVMEMMGWPVLTPELSEVVYPLLVKRTKDLSRMRTKDQFASILATAIKSLQGLNLEDIPDLTLETTENPQRSSFDSAETAKSQEQQPQLSEVANAT
jgi:MoxR-like ATPase